MSSDEPAPNSSAPSPARRVGRLADGIALAALALLAAIQAAALLRADARALVFPDAMEYADAARGLARGDGLVDRAVWTLHLAYASELPPPLVRRAPLFPLAEAAVFAVAGADDLAASATSAFFHLLAAFGAFALARALLRGLPGGASPASVALGAFVAATLALFDPLSMVHGYAGLSESMFACVTLACAAVATAPGFPRRWAVAGFLAGASQTIRLNGFTLLVPCAVAAWMFERDRPARLRAMGAMLAGAAGPLLAMAIRNAGAIGEFSFVGINGAISLNDVGGLTEHGIERALFASPDEVPGLAWALHPDRLGEFVAKSARGLERNLVAALGATTAPLWGLVAAGAAARGGLAGERPRALAAFALAAAGVQVALFATGEYEGPRFYVPLVPLMAATAPAIFAGIARAGDPSRDEDPSRSAVPGRNPTFPARAVPVAVACLLVAAALIPGISRAVALARPAPASPAREAIRSLLVGLPPDAIVLSDVPWAVAWYGDRTGLWIPRSVAEIETVRARSGATRLLIGDSAAGDPELDASWRNVLAGGAPAPWRLEAVRPVARMALFDLAPVATPEHPR